MADKVRAHIFVSGLVQGVFFRENTRQEAEKLGIKGWVKNLPDDRVEAVFEGNRNKVEEMIKWVKNGPSPAKVENIDLNWENFQDEFSKFNIVI